jgi:hypothetical protein
MEKIVGTVRVGDRNGRLAGDWADKKVKVIGKW